MNDFSGSPRETPWGYDMAGANFTPDAEVANDLNRLEKSLRRLRTDYEMFLSGSRKWPPNQLRAEIDAIVRHYLKHTPRRTIDRFRLNTLVHRYQTMSELYRRKMRTMEEGPGRRGAIDPSKPQVLMKARVVRGKATGDQVRDLYYQYREARKARGLDVAGLSYTPFVKKLGRTLAQAHEKMGGRDMELRLDTVGGKVRIAVRPTNRSAAEADRAEANRDGRPERSTLSREVVSTRNGRK